MALLRSHTVVAVAVCWVLAVWAAAEAGAAVDPAASCGIVSPQLGSSQCGAACRRDIHRALVNIYDVMNGWNWDWTTWEENTDSRAQAQWSNSSCHTCTIGGKLMPSYCCWEGVCCCSECSWHYTQSEQCDDYSVVVLQARSGNLAGPLHEISNDLVTLHKHGMTHLDLSRNFITGTISPQIGELANLEVLMLGSNNLTGTVPAQLSRLTHLTQLDLEFNFLHGELTQGQLCGAANNSLQAVYIRANNFTGPLNLTQCRHLEVADIQENGFSGLLPVTKVNRRLTVLRARLNDFSGTLVTELWQLPQLMTIDVTNNSLTGTLPEGIAPSVFLTNLHLGSNNLSGTVPLALAQSSQLSKLDLSDNPWLTGTLPEMRWMLGLQELNLGNTLLSGTIPQDLSLLPYLGFVDIHNTLMTCCSSMDEAEQRANNNTLLPGFLVFSNEMRRSPRNEQLGRDPLLNTYMNTGSNMLCDTIQRSPDQQVVQMTVSRPANLSRQAWVVDPEYFWFMEPHCSCGQGMMAVRDSNAAPVWCNGSRHLHHHRNTSDSQCIDMKVLTCVAKPNRMAKEQIAGMVIGVVAVLLLLVMMTSLSLNMCIARTGKIRRQLNWWHKHLAGMPKCGRMTIVVTDIEGYSDLFKRCPELMYKALTMHNNVIRKAKYTNAGSTVQQEGDSYTLVFHDAFDAVSFCLQAQLALMEVHWPEGLMEAESSSHGASRSSKSVRRTKLSQLDSVLGGGTNGWLRKSRPSMKTASSLGALHHSTDSLQAAGSPAVGPAPSTLTVRGAYSRSRMLDLFRSQPALNGAGTGAFNGLRVRMGVATGIVEGPAESSSALANIMNSSLYKLAVDVSDAGNGGQILMDGATFLRIKEELHPLGAVDANGLNYNKLASRTSLFHLLCLGSLCSSRREMLDADEAVLLDMGEYQVPAPAAKISSLNKAHNALRASLKYVWPTHHLQAGTAGATAGDGEGLPGALEGQGEDAGEMHLLEPTSSLPSAIPLDYLGGSGQQRPAGAEAGGGGGAGTAQQRVRLVQILAPSLVGRAQVWGNNLKVKDSWVCTDAPYFEAPGAREAPLGDTISTSSMRTASDGTSHTGPTTCFPPGLTQQQHQQQDASAAGASPLFSTGSGSTDSPRLGNHAVMDTVTESGGGNAQHPLQVQAQRRSVDLEAQAVLPAHHYQQQQQYSQQQQQQQLCASPSVYSAAGGFTSLASVSAAGGLLGASLGSPLAPPIPPVTMVFMVVEGAKAFGNRRKHLLKEIHAQLSVLLMEALRHVVGGYMCRMQEGDLKYMVAFASPAAALEWCLLVQEAAMYLNWDDARFQRISQLRTEYAEGQLVFRGPRLKMGVCEGVPRTIIPDHLGRADYHGSSINQAARYMDAGAHGGQIACEAELAAAVMAHWTYGGSTGTMSPYDSCSDAPSDQVVRAASAPPVAAGAAGGQLGQGGGESGQPHSLSGAGLDDGPTGLRNSTSRSLDSSMALLGSKEFQQQWQKSCTAQQLEAAVQCGCAAGCQAQAGCTTAEATARDGVDVADGSPLAGDLPTPFLAAQGAGHPAAGGAAAVSSVDTTAASNGAAAAPAPAAAPIRISHSRSDVILRDDSASNGKLGSAAAGSSLSSRLSRLFHKSSSARTRFAHDPVFSEQQTQQQQSHTVVSIQDAGSQEEQQQQGHDPAADSAGPNGPVLAPILTSRSALLHAAVADAPQRMFGLRHVPRLAVEVQAHHLGSFKFKGNPEPLQMVNVMLAGLAGRSYFFPKDPPKGKGNRVAANEGLAGVAVAPLPTLAAQYRARVPHHILEHAPTPAAAPQTKQQLRGQLHASSMPVQRSRTMAAVVHWADGAERAPSGGRRSSSHTLSLLTQRRTPSIPEADEALAAAAAGVAAAHYTAAYAAAGPPGADAAAAGGRNGSSGSGRPHVSHALRSHSTVGTTSSSGSIHSANHVAVDASRGHGKQPAEGPAGEALIPLAVLQPREHVGCGPAKLHEPHLLSGGGGVVKRLAGERPDVEGQQEANFV